MTITTLTIGSVLVVLAGHAITKHGIGNGIVTLMVVGTALYLWWVRWSIYNWSIYNLFLEFFSGSALQEACCISCA